jgi:hypothetical protein
MVYCPTTQSAYRISFKRLIPPLGIVKYSLTLKNKARCRLQRALFLSLSNSITSLRLELLLAAGCLSRPLGNALEYLVTPS